jgi:DNA polymerase (family 10)
VENAEVARLFREMADLLELDGANPFRVRAYRTAARTIETLPEPVARLASGGVKPLAELPGIGDDLARKIIEIVQTGRFQALEDLARRVPRGLLELVRLPGLGPKRARALFDALGVRSLADLRQALTQGRVDTLRGFGAKTRDRLLQAIEQHRRDEARFPRPAAAQYGEAFLEYLRASPAVRRAEIAGSYRRRKDTVGDLDILVLARDPALAVERFVRYPEVEEVVAQGSARAAVRLRSGLNVDLRIFDAESYGAGLYYFTGSKAHNIRVRRLAQERGLKVNEYGVWRDERRIAGRTEREVAAAVGLPLIPPELREDRGEIEAAQQGKLPRLVTLEDIRGDLQAHTTSSDGRDSLEAMARTAEELGYAYLAITDHTPAVRVAGGLDRKGFLRQRRAIAELNRSLKSLTVLAGAEVDILPDGSLDLDDATLQELDLVVASLHSALRLPAAEQTRRIVKALRHPAVDILGHPTARLLGRRPGVEFDFDEVLHVAAEEGVWLEVNAQPDRLDLDDIAIQAAVSRGVPVVISTDAHSRAELGFMHWGVDQARRGWAQARDVANTRTLDKLLRSLRRGIRKAA